MESQKPNTNGQAQKLQPTRTATNKNAKAPPGTGETEDQVTRNQEALGVGKDHRTADMIKKGRGTFP